SGRRTVSITRIEDRSKSRDGDQQSPEQLLEPPKEGSEVLPLKIEVGETKRVTIVQALPTQAETSRTLQRAFPKSDSVGLKQFQKKLEADCILLSAANGPVGSLRYENVPEAPIQLLTLSALSGNNEERKWHFAAGVRTLKGTECEEFQR